MAEGSVKFFNTERGFGFITPSDGSADVFVHAKDLKPAGIMSLQERQKVRFDIVPGRDGRNKAANIALLR